MRYSRQIPVIGEAGQRRLGESSILVAGAGGLGSNLVLLLASSGVGRIVIVDPDLVSESNLNRTPFGPYDVGRPKVEALASLVAAQNPEVELEPLRKRVEEVPMEDLDLVFDCLDNASSRLRLEASAAEAGLTLVHGGVEGLRGQVAHYSPSGYSLVRELFPEPSAGPVPVLGPTASVASSIMALEGVLHLALGRGPLLGRMLIFDLETLSFGEVELPEPEH